MRAPSSRCPSLLVLLLPVVAASACATAEGDTVKPAAGGEGPVLVELFTSQGCSSCPPADRILGRLAAGEMFGRKVVPLSFHVDYWNDLGWSDPYSQAAWTERQHTYARALGDARVYTPELVVNGAVGMVGSSLPRVSAALGKAARPTLLEASASWEDGHLEVTTTAPVGAHVLVAVWEDARTQKISRGENSGATLVNHHIVRRLERVAAAGKRGTVRVALDPSWTSIGAVVFAQRPDMRIVATAALARPVRRGDRPPRSTRF